MSYLLDTNVVSEARRSAARADQGVLNWLRTHRSARMSVSVLVLGEIRHGIERKRRSDPAAAASMERWLRDLEQQFAGRILPVSARIADAWGRMNARRPLPAADGLMAATAAVHSLTFVTRNERDVAGTGIRTVNPFTG